MKRLIAVSVLMMSAGFAQAGECVVLLHGLMRSSTSLNTRERELVEAGFVTANIEYPSRDHVIEELAEIAVPDGLAACREHDDIERIHFVTHSLGGILVRQYLSENEIPELGRVVMLGPPNQGSLAADEMADVPGYDWLNGPAGKQLGKGEDLSLIHI